ncbi:MAG: DoxX family protein [Bdellovibrionales bacterium]
MNQVTILYNRGVDSLQKLNWLPVLLARISMGSIFILSGWGKLHNLPKVTEFFTELGIPFPGINAGLVGVTEFGCGLLILLGLLTRLVSIPLIATMAVAIITAKRSEISSFTDVLGFEEFVYIVIFIWLIVNGAGKISLDTFISARCNKK